MLNAAYLALPFIFHRNFERDVRRLLNATHLCCTASRIFCIACTILIEATQCVSVVCADILFSSAFVTFDRGSAGSTARCIVE